MILDVFSRYVVGWCVAEQGSAQIAKALIEQATEQQQIACGQLTIHADRGQVMRSKPLALLLADLGVAKSRRRPQSANEDPCSKAHFKTLKHRPESPARFASPQQARSFCRVLFDWHTAATATAPSP